MYTIENLQESVSAECFENIMKMVEEFVGEEEWNALDHVLGGQGASGKILHNVASAVKSGLKKTSLVRNTVGRRAANNAKATYNCAKNQYASHMANKPGKDATDADKLDHELEAKRLKQVASDAHTKYHDTKAEYGMR